MPGCSAWAGALRAAGTVRAAGAAGEAQAAEAMAATKTGTSSKDIHRRRIHDLRTRSGGMAFRPASRLIPQDRVWVSSTPRTDISRSDTRYRRNGLRVAQIAEGRR